MIRNGTGSTRSLRFLARYQRLALVLGTTACSLFLLALAQTASASIAYGSLNNFDCVNDTGAEAHGFDIEMEDVHSTDVTYTYDWNHYGTPRISEDNSSPLHPRVLIRYAATRFPDGSWSAYTAIPSGPINPTDGHQFTDPSVNFGGEHYGVGYYAVPTAVRYYWLVDDGTGNLVRGPLVNVSTPTFTYVPPAPAKPAQVVAVVVPPAPEVLPPLQFGEGSWIKEIKTKSHNPEKVQLNELVGDDAGKPQPWANGEPPEVEMEWRLMQTDFTRNDGGKNGELAGAPEGLPDGDEVVTRRYEFFKYIGPIDAESGEAMASEVAADGIHGVGTVTYNEYYDFATGEWHETTVDLSTVEVVGEFFGAQMSGFDVAPVLGLIDHIQDGESWVPYPDRKVVIPGGAAFMSSLKSGALPPGLTFDPVTGVLSGTPTASGSYTFEIEAHDLVGASVTKSYTVVIDGGVPMFNITTSVQPAGAGTTVGDGSYAPGSSVAIEAYPSAGYYFVNWTNLGTEFSTTDVTIFNASSDLDLVANFARLFVTPAFPLNSRVGGKPIDLTLTIPTPAGADGATFSLSSNSPALVVPPTVTIPAWTTSTTVPAQCGTVASDVTATVTASAPDYLSGTATLVVKAPRVMTLAFDATTLQPGGTATGTITLNGPAPSGGLIVALSANSSALTIPTNATVPPGQGRVTFRAAANAPSVDTPVTVTAATPGNKAISATVTVLGGVPPQLSVAYATLGIGDSTPVTVTIPAAPAGGATVALAYAGPVSGPASVAFAAGETAKTVTVTAASSSGTGTITATRDGLSTAKTVNVVKPVLMSVVVSPTSVKGGGTVQVTVTIEKVAPAAGARVYLSTPHPELATVPATVTVPAGAKTASVTASTVTVTKSATIPIVGHVFGGGNKGGYLTIAP